MRQPSSGLARANHARDPRQNVKSLERNTPPHLVAGGLGGWVVGGWWVGWLGWLVGWLGWLGWLAGWLGWLGWLVGWLAIGKIGFDNTTVHFI